MRLCHFDFANLNLIYANLDLERYRKSNITPYDIYSSEKTVLCHMYKKLAQLSQQITTIAKSPTYSKP